MRYWLDSVEGCFSLWLKHRAVSHVAFPVSQDPNFISLLASVMAELCDVLLMLTTPCHYFSRNTVSHRVIFYYHSALLSRGSVQMLHFPFFTRILGIYNGSFVMVFISSCKVPPDTDMYQSGTTSLLGIFIDEALTRLPHIQFVSTIPNTIGILQRLSEYVHENAIDFIYRILMLPYLA